MSAKLVDTDVLIWYLRGNMAATRLLDSLDGWALSAVTYMELAQGCRDNRELSLLQRDLAGRGAKVLPLDTRISDRAISLIETLALSNGLRLADALIAATGLVRELPLVTANVKHFVAIDELRVNRFTP